MKKLLFVVTFAFIALVASAQDIIVLTDATEIPAKVESVGSTEISYHKQSNLNGPVYTVPRSQVMFIKYANGEKDVFNTINKTVSTPAPVQTVSDPTNPRAGRVTFQGYVGLGGFIGPVMGPNFYLNMGTRIYDYLYLGAEIGLQAFPPQFGLVTDFSYFVPLGLDIKGYLPVTKKFYPYAEVLLGAGIGSKAVFHTFLGIGFDASRFSMSVGYENLAGVNAFGAKIGIRFGK